MDHGARSRFNVSNTVYPIIIKYSIQRAGASYATKTFNLSRVEMMDVDMAMCHANLHAMESKVFCVGARFARAFVPFVP